MSQTTCSSLTATAAQDLEKLPVPYPGAGTREDPFVVDWDPADPQDPYNWSNLRKWLVTSCVSLSTFAVSFGSSSYSGGLKYTVRNLHVSDESAVLGISLYVLGFALGQVPSSSSSHLPSSFHQSAFICPYGRGTRRFDLKSHLSSICNLSDVRAGSYGHC